ncbi:MAG: hypothetical protein K0R21_1492 [Anaerocolumna sp.]|jgi:gamma-glutamylcyclotransferase (GGCT)/AIG2-like uncharacterized protein YtfP|nr:hypothetical protein [Anaerocolumna sp.]
MDASNKNFLLFSYGTFRNPMVQKELFDREIELTKAELKGYSLFCEEDGFFSIYEEEGGKLEGSLLKLSEAEMWIADQWEEVPFYERKIMQVITNNMTEKAWVYFRQKTGKKTKILNPELTTTLSALKLKEELILFKQYKATNPLPDGDFYIVGKLKITNDYIWSELKKQISNCMILQMDHKQFLTTVKELTADVTAIVMGNYNFYFNLEVDTYRIPGAVYVLEQSGEVTLILSFPVILLSPMHIMNSFHIDTVYLEESKLSQWISTAGLQINTDFHGEYYVNGTNCSIENIMQSNIKYYFIDKNNWYYERSKQEIASIAINS